MCKQKANQSSRSGQEVGTVTITGGWGGGGGGGGGGRGGNMTQAS